MTIVVREARPSDYAAIGEVTALAYRSFVDASGDQEYLAELRDVARRAEACPVYVAIDEPGGRVVGGAMYVPGPGTPFSEVEAAGEAGIRMVAVAPDAQGRGVGTALVKALLARARADGRRGLVLLTSTSMTTAQRLYRRLGFRRVPERDWEVEPGFVLLCFAIDLTEA